MKEIETDCPKPSMSILSSFVSIIVCYYNLYFSVRKDLLESFTRVRKIVCE